MLPHSLFRSYDIRGEYGAELTPEAAYAVACGYVQYAEPTRVVIGSDCRVSSPALKEQVIKGLVDSGVDVVDIGLVSTDVIYFSTWYYRFDGGLMITASHMPKQFNGIKFLRLDENNVLTPIGRGLGMEELEELANETEGSPAAERQGSLETKDVWDDFVHFTRSFISVEDLQPLRVVMDAGNGMGGVGAEHVFKGLPLQIDKLFFEPDGNFPNHPANPIEEKNRRDIVARVKETGADLGVAWDADCDRVYFIDETGAFVNGDFITALLAIHFLRQKPGSGVVYDLRSTLAVPDWVKKCDGIPHVERVGHTYIKKRMQETKSVFGGEISGHYYFAANSYMENGFVAPLIIMELMSRQNKKLSELVADLGPYYVSGEINFKVADAAGLMKRLEEKYAGAVDILRLDGLSFEFDDWRFNVRPSANDPVIRLNLEAKTKGMMEEKVREVSALMSSP